MPFFDELCESYLFTDLRRAARYARPRWPERERGEVTGATTPTGRQAVAAHFRSRIPALMDAWRAAVADDPQLTAGSALPRSQLEDHLPVWLESFAKVLGAAAGPEKAAADAEEERTAEAHGLQRWQQGYDLHEVTREWGCLHRVLVVELERFVADHGAHADLSEARLKLAELISEATSQSAEKYFRLERMEAAGTVGELEKALTDLRALENARAELWQQAAHDLRGNLGVVSNVAEGLGFQALPAERRQDFLAMLKNNVVALRHLLDDITGLARLHAGQEQRVIASFDAAALLQGLCDDVRSLADRKGLYLRASGPPALVVDGDAVKVRRVAQNLLLNALKYTRSGGVTVEWSETVGDEERWMLTVQDTGPGFHAGPGAPLVSALSAATAGAVQGHEEAPAHSEQRPVQQVQGEGIGLAIVKRLCELMNASIELESAPEHGTTFRVRLPRRLATSG